jgi:F-type H+-transporting ATPase subunit a
MIVRILCLLAVVAFALPGTHLAQVPDVQRPVGAPVEPRGEFAVEPGPVVPPAQKVDIITPHLLDSDHLEVPYWRPPFYTVVHLPHWEPIRIGNFELDMSPTKHVVFMLLAAFLVSLMLIGTAIAHKRHHHDIGRPRGFAAGIEAMVLYLRNEVIMPNVGPGGHIYAPFLLTLFFFILFCNVLGLIPYGATATGNIAVTGMLALITFIVIELAGMRALGKHYIDTIVYWPKDMPLGMRIPMTMLMTPVEIFGKFTKPFALAIRLFANMTAGHVLVLALIGLIFTFRSVISGAPFLMAVAIMILELFVAFLQAFVFTLLSSVFIGQIRTAHH